MSYGPRATGPNRAFRFDPASVPEQDRQPSYQALPPGWYRATVTDSEVRSTKAGGSGIQLTWTVQPQGRTIWQWINVGHPTSEQCVAIGRRELWQLTDAMGLGMIDSTERFHGRLVEICLGIEEDPEYGPRNIVRRVRAIKQPALPQQTALTPPRSQQPPRQQQPQNWGSPQQHQQQQSPQQQQTWGPPPDHPAAAPMPATQWQDDDVPF
ncbi:MAG: hypothetical protein PVJ64_00395 [Gemmatimonadales bacterium]|jgi:hypothetical protein